MPNYKMCIYGEPGVGKSVFSYKFGKSFFVCTDDNFDFLAPFGAKDEDHVHVHSWKEFSDFTKTAFDYKKYDTIVIDVLEDLYLFAENEYCEKNRLEDISDVGYGKGYKIVRNMFVTALSRILGMSVNVIFLCHTSETVKKTPRGVEYTEYTPTTIIPDKVWAMLTGKIRFCFRAHIEESMNGNKLVRRRLLSVSPKSYEFQINRGMFIDDIPDDIDLEPNEFHRIFDKTLVATSSEISTSKEEIKKIVNVVKAEPKKVEIKKVVDSNMTATDKIKNSANIATTAKDEKKTDNLIPDDELPFSVEGLEETNKPSEVVKLPEPNKTTEAPKKVDGLSELEKIRAKIAAMKAGK